MARPFGGATHTYSTLFGGKDIEEIKEIEYRVENMEGGYENRKEFMSEENQKACEARLSLLRAACALLRDPAPDQ